MRIIRTRRLGKGKTIDGTGIDADHAGHAGFSIDSGSFPFRFLHRRAHNAEGVLNGRNRTDLPAGTAFNTEVSVDYMERIFLSPYGLNGTQSPAGTAAIARIGNSIRHVHLHGSPVLPCSVPSGHPFGDPTQTVRSSLQSFFPGGRSFPCSRPPFAMVSR